MMVLVVVDMKFTGGGGGLAEGCGGGTVGGGAVVKDVKSDGTVVGTIEDMVVTKGVTSGNGVVRLGGEGRDAGLTVY